ncbi:MAG: tetratricopeptide repeat protein [Acidobacteriota bacterium]|nr:tetratricopeptide repeat protein [Acidobacteriota bacterium]MDH3784757.1 tetratricopeptide repeat protein [Acidobacteriota bacterium]
MEVGSPSHESPARQRFVARVQSTEEVDLIELALTIASEEYPMLDETREARRVGLIAAEGSRRVHNVDNPFEKLDILRQFFFHELGFCGNQDDYNDPRNCFLNDVLDRRTGIPLTLSLLFGELALASGFKVRGIGLPGHFILRLEEGDRVILVDPFHRGEVVTEDDCRQLVGRTTGRPSLFRRRLLHGSDNRAVLSRLLLNLKHMYVEREDFPRALGCVERLLILHPADSTEVRDRGFLLAHLGREGAAITDLETYLSSSPHAPDAESVRGRVSWLRRRLSETN